MDKPQRKFIVAVIVAAVLVISLRLDLVVAGNIPDSAAVTAVMRFFSLVGNGATLFSIAILLFIIGTGLKKDNLRGAGLYGFYALLLGSVVVHVLKAAFERPRIEHGVNAVLKLLDNPALFDFSGKFNSFPSGHTTVSFALAFVLAKRFPRFGVFFYIIAALVGMARVWLGSHYPSDVAAGALVGLAVGWLVSEVRDKEKWLTAGLILLILFISFFKSGGFLLFDVDEAVFSEASREMVETGDLITPTYNYEPRYDKPILIYWFMSAAFKLFGTGEFAARFTSGLFGTFLVITTFFFMRRATGSLAAFLTALALLLNLEYFVYTHSAVTDMTLAFFISSSIYAFYLGVKEDNPKWFWWIWAASAFAVLTKGVIGALFPFAIAILYLLASKQFTKIKCLFRPAYIILFFAITVPWFAAEFYVNGWEFFNAFIIKHHIQRYSGVISSHSGPVYYYIAVLLIGFFPWVGFLPAAIYKGFKERLDSRSGLYLLAAIWFLFVLVFFSIARTKLPNYIFPLYPPAAILAGLSLAAICKAEAFRKKSGVYIMLVLAGAFASFMFILPSLNIKMDVPFAPDFFYRLGAVFAAVTVFSIIALSRPLQAFIGTAGAVLLMIIYLRLYALPPVNIYLQKTLYEYSVFAREQAGKAMLATYEINKPSIAFYARGKVHKIEKATTCDITEYSKRTEMIIITSPSKFEEIKDFKELRVLDARGDYMLLATAKVAPFKPQP